MVTDKNRDKFIDELARAVTKEQLDAIAKKYGYKKRDKK